LSETEIRSPIDGMIAQMNAETGEVVQGGRTTITGGTVLAVVADVSEIVVYTEVADADIGAVLWLAPVEARPGGESLSGELSADDVSLMVDTSGVATRIMAEGTPVKIRVDAFRHEDFQGIIERIYPEPRKVQNIVTYLVDIKITSDNWKKLALVLGMQADVEFTAQAVKNALLVPHDAIRKGKSNNLGVYVPWHVPGKDETRPKFVPCKFGLDNGLYAELLEGEGINEGTEVYVQLPTKFESGEEETE
jgi:multidrug efflux pump subunit AcrA (membrane-fusion protein)